MALRLLDSLLKRNYNVTLISLDGTREIPLHGNPQRNIELSRHVVQLSDYNAARSTLKKIFTAPQQLLALQRSLQRRHHPIVISFMERANILNLLTWLPCKRIICIRKHLSMALKNKSPLKRTLIKLIYPVLLRRADNINFNARQSAENFRTLFSVNPHKTSVIYNYCDTELLTRLAKQSLPSEYETIFDKKVIISSGRLLDVKGHEFLIRAFKKLQESGMKDVNLIILGEGPLREKLTSLIDRLNLNNRVYLPGYQQNPYPWLIRSTLFVLPSLAEGFPNALLEAMALGLPVITADCPSGPRELLGVETMDINGITYTKYGVLVPRLDRPSSRNDNAVNILFHAMEDLLNDPEKRRISARAAEKRADEFSFENFAGQWEKLIA